MKSIVVVEVSKYHPRHPVLGWIHSQDRSSAIEHSTEESGVVGRCQNAVLAQIFRFQRSALRNFNIALLRLKTAIDAVYPSSSARSSRTSTGLSAVLLRFPPSSLPAFLFLFLSLSSSYIPLLIFTRLLDTPQPQPPQPMSSSTPSSSPVDSGECVVCGQVTTTRCSSCASHGTGWMYFCSREHQKLVSLPFGCFDSRTRELTFHFSFPFRVFIHPFLLFFALTTTPIDLDRSGLLTSESAASTRHLSNGLCSPRTKGWLCSNYTTPKSSNVVPLTIGLLDTKGVESD